MIKEWEEEATEEEDTEEKYMTDEQVIGEWEEELPLARKGAPRCVYLWTELISYVDLTLLWINALHMYMSTVTLSFRNSFKKVEEGKGGESGVLLV